MKIELYNDHFENNKLYNLPRAQFIIADIPYNIGIDAYASNPSWYKGGDNKNGESELAGKNFFSTDHNFLIADFFNFCTKLLKPEPKETGTAPCLLMFCSFEQQFNLIKLSKEYGFNNYINLVFRKNFSAQVLKANMRIVGNCEYGLLFYKEKLPKFNNKGKMVFNCIEWERDNDTEKIHPTQKPINLLKKLIEIFTDPGDVVIDPVAGSGSSLIAAAQMGRKAYGFEINKQFYADASRLIKNIKCEPLLFEMIPENKQYIFEKETT
jgi:site-specific DNA-methyltransferase (adenine-specific)